MFSIIIPLYNKQNCIAETINSVLSQAFFSVEIIVVDDGSIDGSKSVVESIKDNRVHLYTKPNGGPSSARNYGVAKAQGEWILFLDADDILEPNALSVISNTIKSHPGCAFFCFNHYVEANGITKIYSTQYKDGYLCNAFYSWCVRKCMPRAGAAVFKRELLLEHPFDEQLRRYEDAESLFEIMRTTKVYRSHIPIMTYRLDNVSASYARKDISEDFIGHLSMKGKSMWEQYALWQLYLQGLDLYPNDMNRLYVRKEMRTWKVKVADFIIKKRYKIWR